MNTTKQLSKATVLGMIQKHITLLVLILLLVISSILSPNFLTAQNIFNLFRQHSGTAIVSMGMLLVILTGGIDLSVGSTVALSGVLCAYFMQSMSMPLAILLTVLCSCLVGAVTGYFVSFQKVAPFVVSLASMTAARGIAYIVSRGTPITVKNDIILAFGKGSLFKIPFPAIAMIIVVLAVSFLLKYTSTGRFIQAIGSNETSVRLSGIQVNRYKWLVYMLAAACCALAGIISDGRAGVGSPNIAEGMELDAIAACVIGGASLTGGYGTAGNTLIGMLILGLIGNIMNLMNVANYPQQVIKGIIIIAAVLLQKRDDNN